MDVGSKEVEEWMLEASDMKCKWYDCLMGCPSLVSCGSGRRGSLRFRMKGFENLDLE